MCTQATFNLTNVDFQTTIQTTKREKMVKRTVVKSQISQQPNSAAVVKPLKYKEPNDKVAALGYASSFLNGNTVDGGLRSLTYKSIFALQLVDNLTAMRNCIVGEDAVLLRISEKSWANDETINRLRSEISEFKSRKDTRNEENDEQISLYNLRLDDELNQKKEVTSQYSEDLKLFYTTLYPDIDISFNNELYKITRNVSFPVEVKKMQDNEKFDGSIYAAKAEERKREEEEERRREQEKRELEASVKEAAMEVDAPLDDFSEAYVTDLPGDLPNALGGDLPPDVSMDLPLGNDGFNNVTIDLNQHQGAAAGFGDQGAGFNQSYAQNSDYTGNLSFNDHSMGPTF